MKSCLELAALGADAPVTLHDPGPSRDHTARMLRAMGATVISDGLAETVYPGATLRPLDGALPGGSSSAAFLLAAAAILHSEIISLAVLAALLFCFIVRLLREAGERGAL